MNKKEFFTTLASFGNDKFNFKKKKKMAQQRGRKKRQLYFSLEL